MKMFDADKTKMIGLPYGEKNYDNMLSRFHLIPERYGQTDGRTDGHNCVMKTVQDTAIVTMEDEYELVCDLLKASFSMTLNDP